MGLLHGLRSLERGLLHALLHWTALHLKVVKSKSTLKASANEITYLNGSAHPKASQILLWKYPDREKLLLAQLGIKLKKLIIAINNQLGVHQVGNRQLARLMLTAWFLHYYDQTCDFCLGVFPLRWEFKNKPLKKLIKYINVMPLQRGTIMCYLYIINFMDGTKQIGEW